MHVIVLIVFTFQVAQVFKSLLASRLARLVFVLFLCYHGAHQVKEPPLCFRKLSELFQLHRDLVEADPNYDLFPGSGPVRRPQTPPDHMTARHAGSPAISGVSIGSQTTTQSPPQPAAPSPRTSGRPSGSCSPAPSGSS